MDRIILDELNEVLEGLGFYSEGHYHNYCDDPDLEIDTFVEDFLMKKGITQIKTDILDAFESPGYDCSVLSVAYVLDGNLYMETFLLEAF